MKRVAEASWPKLNFETPTNHPFENNRRSHLKDVFTQVISINLEAAWEATDLGDAPTGRRPTSACALVSRSLKASVCLGDTVSTVGSDIGAATERL